MRRLVVSALAAVSMSVTALSVLASPLTEGVARADGSDSAPAADDGSEAKPRHHHHHDDAKDAKDGKSAKAAAAETPAATTPPAAEAPAAPPPAVVAPPTAIVPVIPPAVAAPPAAPVSTPLSLIPSKPLTLASDAPSSNLGWKLGAMGILAAAGFWAYSKKKNGAAGRAPSAPVPEMRILRRTSVGVRSELLLVDLEGQRILLGVTPSNIQSLLIVPDSAMSEPVAVEEPVTREAVASMRAMPSMSQLVSQLEREERSVAQRPPRSEERSVAQRLPRSERTEGSVAQRLPRTEGSVSQRFPRADRPEGSVAARLQRTARDEAIEAEERDVAAKISFPKRRPSVPDFQAASDESLEGQAEGLVALRRSR